MGLAFGAGARARLALFGFLAAWSLTGGAGCKKLASLVEKPPPPVFHRPRVDAALQRMVKRIVDDPKFKAALAEGPSADRGKKLDLAVSTSGYGELGAQLAAKGAVRLSPGQFLEMTKLKLRLAETSPKLCAGFWAGGLGTADLGNGLDRLTDAELERWFELSERALRLQLYATTPLPRFAGQVLVDGMRDIAASLPADEAAAFTDTLQQGTAAPAAAGCSAFLKLSRGAMAFGDPRRDTFLRAMAFDTLVDW